MNREKSYQIHSQGLKAGREGLVTADPLAGSNRAGKGGGVGTGAPELHGSQARLCLSPAAWPQAGC